MKPMLAATVEDIKDLKFPLYASPKLDGIRALVLNGKIVSRNLKTIPNEHVQKLFKDLPDFLDGELIVGKPTAGDCFRKTSSGVMSVEGEPSVCYYIFDKYDCSYTFEERQKLIKEWILKQKRKDIYRVTQVLIKDAFQLHQYEEEMTGRGYEGVMLRNPRGLYKQGRSTIKEQGLMKLKQFEDSEAEILGFRELMRNHNEDVRDELGYAKRSSLKSGLVGGCIMGAINVRDVYSGVEFDIGSGFTEDDRLKFWKTRKKLEGKVVKYKYFPTGSKDKPRFPVFLGFREKGDIS